MSTKPDYDRPPLWWFIPQAPRHGEFFVDCDRFMDAMACTRSERTERNKLYLDCIAVHEMPRQKAAVIFVRNPDLASRYRAGAITEAYLTDAAHWRDVERIPGNLLPKGTRIRFLRDITSGPDEHGPGNHYATADDGGWIDRPGGCKEGHWVYWDGWPSAAFGAELGVDFEAETRDQAEARHAAIVGAKSFAQLTPLEIERWTKASYYAHCARNDVEPLPWAEMSRSWLERARAKHQAVRARWRKGHR